MVFKPDEHDSDSEFDLFEKTKYEPEEYDPEADLYDPDTDSLTIPQVTTSETDAHPEVQKTFWGIVVVLNAAIFMLALGPMLIFFEGQLENGALLIAGGLVLCGLVARRYRSFKRQSENGEFSSADEDEESNAEDEPNEDEPNTGAKSDENEPDE